MDAGVDSGVKEASRAWEKDLNCAESALRGVCAGRGIKLSDESLKLATPFGGGLGRCEDVCGALSGAIMGIGAELGRTDGQVDKKPAYAAAKKTYSAFQAEFGSTSCRVLNKGDFESKEHDVRCKKFVLEAVKFAIQSLDGK